MFSAAVALSSGHIVFAPWHAGQVGVFEVATSAFGRVAMRSTPSSDSDVSAPKLCENKPCTRFSLGSMSGGSLGFGGASVAGDGTVVFAPSDAAGIGVWSLSPADVTYFTCKTDTPVAFFVAGFYSASGQLDGLKTSASFSDNAHWPTASASGYIETAPVVDPTSGATMYGYGRRILGKFPTATSVSDMMITVGAPARRHASFGSNDAKSDTVSEDHAIVLSRTPQELAKKSGQWVYYVRWTALEHQSLPPHGTPSLQSLISQESFDKLLHAIATGHGASPVSTQLSPGPVPSGTSHLVHDNEVVMRGRCGPLFGNANCDCAMNPAFGFCNEGSGRCGDSDAFRDAEASALYDSPPCSNGGSRSFAPSSFEDGVRMLRPTDLKLDDGYAYIATLKSQGTVVVDMFDAAGPNIIGNVDMDGPTEYPGKLAKHGHYVYQTRRKSGGDTEGVLAVIDVSAPWAPTLCGAVTTTAPGQDVAVRGDFAYVTSSHEQAALIIISIADPTNPTVTGRLIQKGCQTAVSLALDTSHIDYAYMACAGSESQKIAVVHISDATAPTVAHYLHADLRRDSDNDLAPEWAVGKNFLYMSPASSQNDVRLFIVDVTFPLSPTIAGFAEDVLLGQSYTLDVAGEYVYVASNDEHRIVVIDVSVPSAPTIVLATMADPDDSVSSEPRAIRARASGDGRVDMAWIDFQTSSFHMAQHRFTDQLTHLPHVALVGRATLGAYNRGVAANGNFVYIAGRQSGSLEVLDVSSPDRPQLIGSVDRIEGAYGVSLRGSHVMVALSSESVGGLAVVDVTDPSAPSVVGFAPVRLTRHESHSDRDADGNVEVPNLSGTEGNSCGPTGLALSGAHALVTCGIAVPSHDMLLPDTVVTASDLSGELSVQGAVQVGDNVFSDNDWKFASLGEALIPDNCKYILGSNARMTTDATSVQYTIRVSNSSEVTVYLDFPGFSSTRSTDHDTASGSSIGLTGSHHHGFGMWSSDWSVTSMEGATIDTSSFGAPADSAYTFGPGRVFERSFSLEPGNASITIRLNGNGAGNEDSSMNYLAYICGPRAAHSPASLAVVDIGSATRPTMIGFVTDRANLQHPNDIAVRGLQNTTCTKQHTCLRNDLVETRSPPVPNACSDPKLCSAPTR